MNNTTGNPDGQAQAGPDDTQNREGPADAERSLNNRPEDPNRIGGNVQVPPGVKPDDLHDPGRQTPGAPPVDNRS